MKKRKVGLWLPARRGFSPISAEKPGMWIKGFRDKFVSRLKKEKNIDVIENLDFRKAFVKNGEVFLNGFCLSDLDLFFWFGEIDRSHTSYDVEVLEAIEKNTKVVNDPKALKIGLDKFYSQLELKQHGISVPAFFLAPRDNLAQMKKEAEEKQLLLKPRLGSFGSGIMKVNGFQNLVDMVDYSEQKSHFLEEFIEFDFTDWIGVNVIGKKIAYCYGKQSSKISGWKVFDRDRKGGKMTLKKPSAEQQKIALDVGKATGLDIFGVDIIKSLGGKNFVIDVNTFPGLYPKMFEKAGVEGTKMLVELLKSKLFT